MRFAAGGKRLERLAGAAPAHGPRPPRRWPTIRAGTEQAWPAGEVGDAEWLRGPLGSAAREVAQQVLLFPATRWAASPRIVGAADLAHAPQPAILAPNHASDIDTPLVLLALPRAWRSRTVVGAAADRFYRRHRIAVATGLLFNTFPFDRGGGQRRGLATAATHLREGRNVLLYPQGTREAGAEGYRRGVADLALATGAPLIPIQVTGSALVMPKGRGLDRRARTTVTFGRPLAPAHGETPSELTARLEAAIAALERRR